MKVLIAGGGIGGLIAALFLHRKGIDCEIHERVPEVQEVGVGLTILPHAVILLSELGIFDALDKESIRTEYMYFRTRWGQTVWEEPRGLAAGYPIPQLSIHRGRLHAALYDAVRERVSPEAVHLGSNVTSFVETATKVRITTASASGPAEHEGDILIGADGIHSAVRRQLYPDEGVPRWSGRMLWRGSTDWPVFLDGRTIINSGGADKKFIVYPIAAGEAAETRLTNWAAVVGVADAGRALREREDWSRGALREGLSPLPHLSFGRPPLLGDAAHPMYPFGANGAAQAIIDAKCISERLASAADPVEALKQYEIERLEPANKVVSMNRSAGPEGVIDTVEARCSGPVEDLNEVMPFAEREAVVRGYAKAAGFARDQVRRD